MKASRQNQASNPGFEMHACTSAESSSGQAQPAFNHFPVIQSMTLVNFMCHEHLKVEFGPHINFIVGQNGSGKSAILAALMVSLGSTASKTQRGHKISSLIKEGSNFFSVAVTLFNGGSERFQWEKFGDSITVERKVTLDGSSTYRLRNSTGSSVGGDKPREVIREIISFYRLQIENPLILLTQDIAKRYLATSSATERYRLVMQGSQLQRLSEDYEQAGNLVSLMRNRLSIASDRIVDQTTKVGKIQSQLDAIKEAREMLANLEAARREFVWAQVFSLQESALEACVQVDNLKVKLQNINQEIQSHTDSLVDMVSKEEASKASTEEIRSTVLPPLRLKVAQIESQVLMISSQISNCETDERVLSQGRMQLLESIDKANAHVDREANNPHATMAPETGDQVADALRELSTSLVEKESKLREIDCQKAKAEEQVSSTESQLDEIKANEACLCCSLKLTREQLEALEARIPAAKLAITSAELSMASNAPAIEGQRLTSYAEIGLIYGPQMLKLVQHLDALPESKPVGPIGRFVHLKEASIWATAMDALIGRHMSSFVVSSYPEREILNKLLSRFEVQNSQVILLPETPETFMQFPETSEILTARKALEISSPIVEKALCTLSNIHRVLLCKERTEAVKILSSTTSHRLFDYAFLATGQKISLSGAAQTFFSFGSKDRPSRWFGTCGLSESHSTGSVAIANAKVDLEAMHRSISAKRSLMSSLSQQLAQKEQIGNELSTELSGLNSRVKEISFQRSSLVAEIRQMAREKASLEEELSILKRANDPAAISASQQDVQSAKDAALRRVAIIDAQLNDLSCKRSQLQERHLMLTQQLSESQCSIKSSEAALRIETDNMSSLVAGIRDVKASLEGKRIQLVHLEGQLPVLHKSFHSLTEEHTDAYGKAIEHWPPAPLASEVRPLDDIQRHLRSLEQQLEAQRKAHSSHAANLQEDSDRLLMELRMASLSLGCWTQDASSFGELIQALDKSLNDRHSRWLAFRDIIFKRADLHFRMFVSARGFYGRLLFDHEAEKLDICIVRPSDMSQQAHPPATTSSSVPKRASNRTQVAADVQNKPQLSPSASSTDLKGLSGGEKSLVTSCLLLALWECVESPLRCLDEFDVFMDGVNRKTILKMLIEYATSTNSIHCSNQYIFITPQALDLPRHSTDVKIIRLRDPQRSA